MKTCGKYEWRSVAYKVHTQKALAEIYTKHSFAPFWNPQSKTGEKRTWPKQPRKGENERPLSSSSLPSTSAKGGCEEKLTRMKIEYAYDIWSPLFWLQIQMRCPLGSVFSGLHFNGIYTTKRKRMSVEFEYDTRFPFFWFPVHLCFVIFLRSV